MNGEGADGGMGEGGRREGKSDVGQEGKEGGTDKWMEDSQEGKGKKSNGRVKGVEEAGRQCNRQFHGRQRRQTRGMKSEVRS